MSLDHLPNPTGSGNPYIPGNRPAIGDLFDMFDFKQAEAPAVRAHAPRLRGERRMSRAFVHIPNWAR